MKKEEAIEFFNEQVDLEYDIVKAAVKTTRGLKNLLVKELVRGIALDSAKHANLLRALVNMYESKTPFLSEEERNKIAENIKWHIELEKKAIETYKKLADEIDNEKAKFVVQQIYEDELRHHDLLQKLYKMVVEAETLTEEDLWDLVWKDTAFKGTPGG